MTTNIERVQWMEEQLRDSLQPSFLSIQDDSHKHAGHEGAKGGGGHFTVEIWCNLFENKPSIECHRMIYTALNSAIPHDIHALKIKLKKPKI